VDCWGRLIGVVVADRGDSSAMNLAIPVDTTKRVVMQIIRDGKTATPFVGITVASGCIHEARSGMLFDAVAIEKVVPESPAESPDARQVW
jgi:2-alkenal reductase